MTAVAIQPLAYVAFERSREPDPEWVALLREHSPMSDEHSFLELVWEPGEEWIPGQRWVLYEMLHPKFIDSEVMKELRGPHPRSEGHMCSVNVPKQFQCLCRRKLESWKSGPCVLVTLTQWQLFRKTGYVGRAYWVIQGENGGHKRAFTEERERQMLKMADLPPDPPAIGALPYAPFDQRVVKQITRHNRLKSLGVSLGQLRQMMGPGYEATKKKAATELRREYIAWLSDQLGESAELFVSAARKGEMYDEPRSEVEWREVEAQAMEHYAETGDVLHHSQIRTTF